MMFFRTDVVLFPGAPHTTAFVRLLQFVVADALDELEIAIRSARRLLVELADIDHPQVRALQTSLSTARMFLTSAELPVDLQLEVLLSFQREMPHLLAIEGVPTSGDIHAGRAGCSRISGSLQSRTKFALQRASWKPSRRSTVFPRTDRDRFLRRHGPATRLPRNFCKRRMGRRPDRRQRCGSRFGGLRSGCCGRRDMEQADLDIELVAARCIILDEMAGDIPAAIALVDSALATFPADPVLLRQKAKLLAHSENAPAAAAIFLTIEDTIGDSPVDKGLALREGGVWAHRSGLFGDALRLFDKAAQAFAASVDPNTAILVGLRVDRALTLWDIGEREGSLREMAVALKEVNTLDPNTSAQHQQAHQFVRGALGDLLDRSEPFPLNLRIAVGRASAPTARQDLEPSKAFPPIDVSWRILALIEARLGLNPEPKRRLAIKCQRECNNGCRVSDCLRPLWRSGEVGQPQRSFPTGCKIRPACAIEGSGRGAGPIICRCRG